MNTGKLSEIFGTQVVRTIYEGFMSEDLRQAAMCTRNNYDCMLPTGYICMANFICIDGAFDCSAFQCPDGFTCFNFGHFYCYSAFDCLASYVVC